MNFRFLNIPVFIHPSFWLFLLFFTGIIRGVSIEGLILGGVLFLSLLVHEYGHALTALYFGARPIITLEAFGGQAQYDSYRITPKQRFIITLNGPLLESVLIGLSYALLEMDIFENYYVRYFLSVTLRLNILWCLLNLIPVVPLDGGHILRYLLEKKFGESGQKLSSIIGVMCAVGGAPILFYLGYFFFGILLLIFAYQNFQMIQKPKSLPNGKNQYSRYLKGVEAIKNNDLENAKLLLTKLLKSKQKEIKHAAIESLAKVYIQENESQKSYELLLQADHELLKEGKCLLCQLAFEQKNYALVGNYAWDIYGLNPSYEIALLNSKAFACLNQPSESGAWLETASLFGTDSKKSIEELLQQQIYASVKEHKAFQEYSEKIVANLNKSE